MLKKNKRRNADHVFSKRKMPALFAKPFIFFIFFALLFSGCARKEDPNTSLPVSEDSLQNEYDFIFVCPIMDNEYWKECQNGIRKADAELGTHTRIIGPQTSNNFADEITEYMKEAISQEPDGIMLYAGIEGLFPLIEEATRQGIPVLATDSDAPDTSRIAYVGTNDYSLGYEAGETMVNLTGGSGRIGILTSSSSVSREMRIVDAFLDAINDYDLEVVALAETEANPEIAARKATEMLTAHPEITALYNLSGYNVTGAARAKEQLGLQNLILIGYDDIEENLQYVREGIIDAIFVQQPKIMGYQSVCLMKEYLDKGSLNRESYDSGTILVTKNNVDTYSDAELTSDSSGKKVRIGYYSGADSFQQGFEDTARKSGYAYEYYQAIATLTGWEYEYVYGSREDILNSLLSGEVDIAAGMYQTDIMTDQVLFSKRDMGLDGEPRYFVVRKNRPDLLVELDYAMEQLLQFSPNFSVMLQQKYYSYTNQRQTLTDREQEWLEEKGDLRVGYVRHNLPISEQAENGKPTGLVSDLFSLIGDYLKTPLTPVCYENVTEMETALRNNEIDAAFPIYSDLWLTETKGFRQTDSFLNDRAMIVYQGSYSSDLLDKVALNQCGLGQRYYMAAYYPESEIVYCNSWEEIFASIKAKEHRCTVGCSSVLQHFILSHPEYQDMNIAYMDTSESFGMAVNISNSLLAEILNKAIRSIDTATITASLMYYSSVDTPYTFKDFIQQNALLLIFILIIFFSILLFVFVNYRRKTRIFNEEQAKTQAALKDALQAASNASHAKTTFLSGMSHDIRTPMNAIVGMSAIASKHLDDTEKVKDCLDKIDLSSRHLLTLINDVLDISKIESGKLTLNPISFSLKDMMTTLVNIIRPEIRSKNLEFDVHIHNIEHEVIFADEVRVNQIFINILSNAVKYTPAGGRITIDLSEEVQPDLSAVCLRYVVADTGIGMSETFMENMYETFSRAEDRRISKIQGTGLGLSIVKQMVDMMNGSIDCQSAENEGTTFIITLNLPIAEENSDLPPLPPISVLLIDDDEIFLETTKDCLQNLGVSADTVTGGAFAIEQIKLKWEQNDPYSVIIVDWKMPDMDGFETTKQIRSITGNQTPIILVSAYDWTDMEAEAKELGANGFITKPLFQSYIHEKLLEALHLANEPDIEETPLESELKGKHLLIAEDNDLNWEVIYELLSMFDISAERAVNGQVCVDMITKADPGTYDLILMDIQMPILNGRDATRVIRSNPIDSIKNIPIIAMTADAFAEDIAACMEAGMDGHVSKPVDMNILFQEMQRIL